MEEWRSFRQQPTREAVAYVFLGLAMSRGDASAHLAQRVEEGKGTPGGLGSDRSLNQVSNCRTAALYRGAPHLAPAWLQGVGPRLVQSVDDGIADRPDDAPGTVLLTRAPRAGNGALSAQELNRRRASHRSP